MYEGASGQQFAPCSGRRAILFWKRLTICAWIILAGIGWAANDAWELVSDEDGIQVFQKTATGHSTISLRGEAIIDARLKDIVDVMTNNAAAHLWVPMVAERRTLQVTAPNERIEYTHLKMPWPLTDRYFINRGRAEELPDGVLRLYVQSVEQPTYKDDSKVLGILHYSEFLLTPLDNGTRTRLTLEVNSDPRGSIPTWMVNRAQKKWPREFIKGLIGQLAQKQLLTVPTPNSALQAD